MRRTMTRMGHRPKDPSEKFMNQAIFHLSVKGPVSFPGGGSRRPGGAKGFRPTPFTSWEVKRRGRCSHNTILSRSG